MSKLEFYVFLLFSPLVLCSMEINQLPSLAYSMDEVQKSVTFTDSSKSNTQLTASSGEEKKTFIPVNLRNNYNKRSMSEKDDNRVILETESGDVITKKSANAYFKQNEIEIDNVNKENRIIRELSLQKNKVIQESLLLMSSGYRIKYTYILGLMNCVKNLQKEGLYIHLDQKFVISLSEKQSAFLHEITRWSGLSLYDAFNLYVALDNYTCKLIGQNKNISK